MIRYFFLAFIVLCTACCDNRTVREETSDDQSGLFVRVSRNDPRYFELSDGSPYIPIGLNMVGTRAKSDEEILPLIERWMTKLAENRGNYIRLWLSHRNWDIENEKSGVYGEVKAARIDSVLAIAYRHGIRVKMTLEHFRNFNEPPRWNSKPIHLDTYGGPAKDVTDFFTGEKSIAQFKRKLDWYRARYGDNPTVFAWELWNEVNCIDCNGRGGWTPEQVSVQIDWTKLMLGELRDRFPENMTTQSLGSFDVDRIRDTYRIISLMPENSMSNVHRYLDLGAELEVCRGPVDILAADAIREMLANAPRKPALLAEAGAVEPNHAGPFKLYQKDTAGIILHDVLFAPFFAGAAGSGQIWHWDEYVDEMDLWWQFDRFAETVEGLDPAAEKFTPFEIGHERLRVYAISGKHTLLVWCRDAGNTWRTELAEGLPPERLNGLTVDLSGAGGIPADATVHVYDPWKNSWSKVTAAGNRVTLPPFTRSVILKVVH